MTLRRRLGLAFVLVAVLLTGLFGFLVYSLFSQQQQAQLESGLARELARVAGLMANPEAGALLAGGHYGGMLLQLVTAAGEVAIPRATREALPLGDGPNVVARHGRLWLVHHTGWGRSGGTIRIGLDVTDAYAARRGLRRDLLLAGGVVIAVAAWLGLTVTRVTLAPLAGLLEQTRALDPASPHPVVYRGPEDEIASLARALNTALIAIRARQKAEHGFLAEVAHELAAPLTVVAGQLASLARDQPGSLRLEAARLASQELLYTSQDLLSLARGELGRPLEVEVVALADVSARVASEYPGLLLHPTGSSGVLSRVPDGVSGRVVGDPVRLVQVVRNLVRNAVQATGAAEGVELRLDETGDEVLLTVSDRGVGMTEEQLATVFDRFASGGRGAGVGLSIVRSIVEAHGGSVDATSEFGRGSCFTVRLPSFASRLDRAGEATPPGQPRSSAWGEG